MIRTRIGGATQGFAALVVTLLAGSLANAQTWSCPVYGPWGVYYVPYSSFYPLVVNSAAAPASKGRSVSVARSSAASGYAASPRSRPDYYSEDYTGPAGAANAPSKVAYIRVRVPANAEVWINNEKRTQSGTVREFVTPALDSEHVYVYNVKARWREAGGINVEKTRRVRTISGTRVTVNFARPSAEQPRPVVRASAAPASPPPSLPRSPRSRVDWTSSNAAPRSFRGTSP